MKTGRRKAANGSEFVESSVNKLHRDSTTWGNEKHYHRTSIVQLTRLHH
jgi:hypothetical protein